MPLPPGINLRAAAEAGPMSSPQGPPAGPPSNPQMEVMLRGGDAPEEGADPSAQSATQAMGKPLMAGSDTDAIDTSIFSQLVTNFLNERSISNQAQADRRSEWEVSCKNYELSSNASGGTTSKAFYGRYSTVADEAQADLLKLLAPPGGNPFSITLYGSDYVADAEKSTEITKLVGFQLEQMNISGKRRVQAHNLTFFGVHYMVGPILNEEHLSLWTMEAPASVKGAKGKPSMLLTPVNAKPNPDMIPSLDFETPDPRDCYPDPSPKDPGNLGWFHHRRVITRHEMEKLLAEAIADPETEYSIPDIQKLLSMQGNWRSPGWWEPANPNAQNTFVVWERLGFLTENDVRVLRSVNPAFNDRDAARGVCRVWYTDENIIIRACTTKVNPNKVPVIMGYAKRPTKGLFGPSMLRGLDHLWEMVNNAWRAIDDQTADLSGVSAIIDADRVHNSDLSIKGRKTWLYRKDPLDPAGGGGAPPVQYQTIPNNLQGLVGLVDVLESKIPFVTGLPQFSMDPASMGSGVRTNDMMEAIWESCSKFIRLVVGNQDELMDEPMLNAILGWIAFHQPDRFREVALAQCVSEGVQGAIAREITAKRAMNVFQTLQDGPLAEWINEPDFVKMVELGMATKGFRMVKTAAEVLAKRQAVLAEEQMKAEAAGSGQVEAASVQVHEKKVTSARDVAAGIAKDMLKSDPTNPLLGFWLEAAAERSGQANDQFYTALQMLQTRNVRAAQQGNYTAPGFEALLQKGGPESPDELEAGAQPVQPGTPVAPPPVPGVPAPPVMPADPAAQDPMATLQQGSQPPQVMTPQDLQGGGMA